MRNIVIRPFEWWTPDLMPVQGQRAKAWWQDNEKTKNHAHHCQPLAMVNSLGYQILAPVSFTVEWNGDPHANAIVNLINPGNVPVATVDDHAAFGSFTVQPGFIVQTQNVGDFLFVKGIPNERGLPYSCMEALIETWWSPAPFGLVFLLNQPGKFMVVRGQPIAQMCVFRQEGGFAGLQLVNGMPEHYPAWQQKRNHGTKLLDYMNGRLPDGTVVPSHVRNWTDEPK